MREESSRRKREVECIRERCDKYEHKLKETSDRFASLDTENDRLLEKLKVKNRIIMRHNSTPQSIDRRTPLAQKCPNMNSPLTPLETIEASDSPSFASWTLSAKSRMKKNHKFVNSSAILEE